MTLSSLLDGKFEMRLKRLGFIFISLSVIRYLAIHNQGFTRGPTLCIFKLLTGYPCPVCGTTRAIAALSEGRFHASWSFNPLGMALFLVLLTWASKFSPLDRQVEKFTIWLSGKSLKKKVLTAFAVNLLMWGWDSYRF